LNNGGLNYEQLRTVLMNPKEEVHNDSETHVLMESLHLITEMSDQSLMDAFIVAAKQQNITLAHGPQAALADVSLYYWLNHSSLCRAVLQRGKPRRGMGSRLDYRW
jgi:hypothetical protein